MAKVKFEDTLKSLEEIVERLEAGDLSLDDTLSEYEKGIKLYKQCLTMLENTEKKIQVLIKDDEGNLRTKNLDMEPT